MQTQHEKEFMKGKILLTKSYKEDNMMSKKLQQNALGNAYCKKMMN